MKVGPPEVDLGAVVARKDAVVEAIRSGSYRAVDKAGTIDFYPAEGHFVAPRLLRVEGTELQADRVFLPGTPR